MEAIGNATLPARLEQSDALLPLSNEMVSAQAAAALSSQRAPIPRVAQPTPLTPIQHTEAPSQQSPSSIVQTSGSSSCTAMPNTAPPGKFFTYPYYKHLLLFPSFLAIIENYSS